MKLEFLPIAFNVKRFGNNTSICPLPGEEVDGRIVDTNCSVDKFEICLTHTTCASDTGCDVHTQAKLVDFLACFEGENHASFSAAEPCAKKAGLDLAPAFACYHNDALREKLWSARLALPYRKKLNAFPTVLVGGSEWNGGNLGNLICDQFAKTFGSRSPLCTSSA